MSHPNYHTERVASGPKNCRHRSPCLPPAHGPFEGKAGGVFVEGRAEPERMVDGATQRYGESSKTALNVPASDQGGEYEAASPSLCDGESGWRPRLYSRGEQPMTLLKAVLKALSDS
jgi:hypothetical protein